MDNQFESKYLPLMQIIPSALIEPVFLAPGAPAGPVPVISWMIEVVRPRLVVELGTLHGTSFLASCQCVRALDLPTSCVGVGAWSGGPDGDVYLSDMLATLRAILAHDYAGFASLLDMDAAGAAARFEDGAADLIVLPHSHSYDAYVELWRHWKPKLSQRGVMVLPGIIAMTGASNFWPEVRRGGRFFELRLAGGTGVVLGPAADPQAFGLAEGDTRIAEPRERLLARLTAAIDQQVDLEWARLELEMRGRDHEKLKADLGAEIAALKLAIQQAADGHATQMAKLAAEMQQSAIAAQQLQLQKTAELQALEVKLADLATRARELENQRSETFNLLKQSEMEAAGLRQRAGDAEAQAHARAGEVQKLEAILSRRLTGFARATEDRWLRAKSLLMEPRRMIAMPIKMIGGFVSSRFESKN